MTPLIVTPAKAGVQGDRSSAYPGPPRALLTEGSVFGAGALPAEDAMREQPPAGAVARP
jgi:hypothetical protein